MASYDLTLPVRVRFDRKPTTQQVAGMLDRVRETLVDQYGPPLDGEGGARFDDYDGPFVTHVGLGEL